MKKYHLAFFSLFVGFCFLFAPPVCGEQEDPVTASAQAAEKWLQLVDQGKYGESWDQASFIFKVTIPRNDWTTMLDGLRKPLGKVRSRKISQHLEARNPKNLPPGDYMAIFYQTDFERKKEGFEMITMVLTEDGWRMLTYHVN